MRWWSESRSNLMWAELSCFAFCMSRCRSLNLPFVDLVTVIIRFQAAHRVNQASLSA